MCATLSSFDSCRKPLSRDISSSLSSHSLCQSLQWNQNDKKENKFCTVTVKHPSEITWSGTKQWFYHISYIILCFWYCESIFKCLIIFFKSWFQSFNVHNIEKITLESRTYKWSIKGSIWDFCVGLSVAEKPRERYMNPHETGTRSQHSNVNRGLRSTSTEGVWLHSLFRKFQGYIHIGHTWFRIY